MIVIFFTKSVRNTPHNVSDEGKGRKKTPNRKSVRRFGYSDISRSVTLKLPMSMIRLQVACRQAPCSRSSRIQQ